MKQIDHLNHGLFNDFNALEDKKVNPRNIQARVQVADVLVRAANSHAAYQRLQRRKVRVALYESCVKPKETKEEVLKKAASTLAKSKRK